MPIAVEMQISLQHLRAKKAGFVSLTTWISVIGIALGVAVLIVVVGVMTGFQREIRIKLLGTQSHIEVYKIGEGAMEKWREVISHIQDVPEIVAASPFVFGQVMLTSRTGVAGAIVRGIDPSREIDVTDIGKYIQPGSLERLNSHESIIASDRKKKSEIPSAGLVIGEVLATILGANVGDDVTMVSPVGVVTPAGMLPLTRRFKVVGTFRSGFYQFDSGMAFISIKDAQDFFGIKDGVTGIHARVRDIFAAEKVANELQKDLKNLKRAKGPYWARSWQRMNVNLFSALKTERITMFILLLLVIIVAAFNIVGSLIMVVMEKGKEIAILISMGATRGAILRIFFIQGAIMGLSGSVLGTVGGLTLGWKLSIVENFLEKFLGLDILPASVYHIDKLPVRMTFVDVTATAVIAVIISLGATLYPAWRASRVDPVEMLRYG